MATKVIQGAPVRRGRREKAPSTPDPIEIAMVAAASKQPLPDAARNVLEKHARLIDCQAELARAQVSELRLRHVGEGVRAALWAFLALAAFMLITVILSVVVKAARTDALIVQSFRVPPSLEARGLTGEVVATQVLDKLADMQERTQSVRAASTYANNWEDDLKIDIPNTGATTDQVWKLLRGWLGKETRITGEVVETGKGLALTSRVGAKAGERFVSDTGDLDALVAQVAELIYKRTQPYRHAVSLGRTDGRQSERYELLLALANDPSPVERKWAYSGLAYDRRLAGRFRESVAMAKRALAIDPELSPGHGNLALAQGLLGHDQQMVDTINRELRVEDSDQYDPAIDAANRCSSVALMGAVLRDPVMIDASADCKNAPPAYQQQAIMERANAALLRHEPESALALRSPAGNVSPQAVADELTRARLRAEMDRGVSPALADALAAYVATAERGLGPGSNAEYYRASAPTQVWPLQAEALVMLGRYAEARELIDRTPSDCYECVRTRGLVAGAGGDPAAAQRWFAEAVRQGPRLPTAYVDWARLLARHKRFEGAQARFAKAAKLAPNWADPLKYWGDMLAAQGRKQAALNKYDAALRLAPKWTRLRQNRARVPLIE